MMRLVYKVIIHGIYIKLTEKDNIILFYKNDFFIGNNKLREFIISKEKKVTDAIKFYDEYLKIKHYIKRKTIFGVNSDISKKLKMYLKN